MDRLERVRVLVDQILRQQADLEERRCGFVHLYGVSQAGVLLAFKRGLDVELAALAGMLHDIATYHTHDSRDHAARSAVEARQILLETGGFNEDEIEAVCGAIARHSDKAAVEGALAERLLSEVLKDADVLQHHLYNPALGAVEKHDQVHMTRLERVLEEIER